MVYCLTKCLTDHRGGDVHSLLPGYRKKKGNKPKKIIFFFFFLLANGISSPTPAPITMTFVKVFNCCPILRTINFKNKIAGKKNSCSLWNSWTCKFSRSLLIPAANSSACGCPHQSANYARESHKYHRADKNWLKSIWLLKLKLEMKLNLKSKMHK